MQSTAGSPPGGHIVESLPAVVPPRKLWAQKLSIIILLVFLIIFP
jgi:hypothetical protein